MLTLIYCPLNQVNLKADLLLEKYQGTLKEGETLTLRINKPADENITKEIRTMTEELKVGLDWAK